MKVIFKLAGLLVLATSLWLGWLWMEINRFAQAPIQLHDQAVEFEIKPGTGLDSIAQSLAEQGIIDQARPFVWLARWREQARRIQAGEYLIEPSLSGEQLLQLFVAGKVRQHAFTIIEGWTFRQMLQAVHAQPKLDHTLKGLSDAEIMARIGHEGEHPEGRFLPDTYFYTAGTSDVQFLQRAYAAMSEALARSWEARQQGLPIKNPYQALILASIVEKETAVASERDQIAGVFMRRLTKGMRLQTDPTVIYGLGEAFQGNLRKQDLKRDSPYNTYLRRGLPPTPIALPSLEALQAAVNPKPGDSLYFVAKGDGSHYFSSSIKEHNQAVRKYQIYSRKKNYRSTPGEL